MRPTPVVFTQAASLPAPLSKGKGTPCADPSLASWSAPRSFNCHSRLLLGISFFSTLSSLRERQILNRQVGKQSTRLTLPYVSSRALFKSFYCIDGIAWFTLALISFLHPFKTTLLRHNWHIINLKYLKHTILWVLTHIYVWMRSSPKSR